MDPTRQLIDQWLLGIGIGAYIAAALALFAYFLMRHPLLRTIGISLAAAGCVAQFGELGARWWMTGVWPLTNLYGSLSLFSAASVAIFLVFTARYDLAFAGGFVTTLAAIAFTYGTTWNEGYMPAVPALQSYWIKIHVPIVITAYASFMVAFSVALIYLLKSVAESRYARRSVVGAAALSAAGPGGAANAYAISPGLETIRSGTPALDQAAAAGDATAQWLTGLPTLAKLDIMQYRIIALRWSLLALGIITGAMWAKEAWGAYWQWDPKETAALASWIVYAIYIHLHTRPEWRGTRSTIINVIGFASIFFCYLGVNVWIGGSLHSYKM
ncbi:MAG TPA: c-type cytochrome biogenesis protein CcsB [Candidatus Limnocylindrales bacterium]|nr:c-type cytochrome biogenesis protein CcsB [Candidatus Limnocylindrales bacterium]